MRFNCGPSREEKRETKRRAAELVFRRLLAGKVTKFALWPVRLNNGECAWLERVRIADIHIYNSLYKEWRHASPADYCRYNARFKYIYAPLDK